MDRPAVGRRRWGILMRSPLRFGVLPALCGGLAGCPALLSDDFVISQDAGANDSGLADGGNSYYDAGTAPLEADSSMPIDAAVCNAPTGDYYKNYPTSWCTNTLSPDSFVGTQSGLTIIIGRDAKGTCVALGEDFCAGCNYTCDCVLKDRCPNGHDIETDGGACTCEQAAPGGIILFATIEPQ